MASSTFDIEYCTKKFLQRFNDNINQLDIETGRIVLSKVETNFENDRDLLKQPFVLSKIGKFREILEFDDDREEAQLVTVIQYIIKHMNKAYDVLQRLNVKVYQELDKAKSGCSDNETLNYLEMLSQTPGILYIVAVENELNMLATPETLELKLFLTESQLLLQAFFLSSLDDPIFDRYGLSMHLTYDEILQEMTDNIFEAAAVASQGSVFDNISIDDNTFDAQQSDFEHDFDVQTAMEDTTTHITLQDESTYFSDQNVADNANASNIEMDTNENQQERKTNRSRRRKNTHPRRIDEIEKKRPRLESERDEQNHHHEELLEPEAFINDLTTNIINDTNSAQLTLHLNEPRSTVAIESETPVSTSSTSSELRQEQVEADPVPSSNQYNAERNQNGDVENAVADNNRIAHGNHSRIQVPNFEVRKLINGKHQVFVFANDERTRCYRFIEKHTGYFYCRKCHSKNRHNVTTTLATMNVVELPIYGQHVCEPVEYYKSDYVMTINFEEYSSTHQQNELILYANEERTLIYRYHKSDKIYKCNKCNRMGKFTEAQIRTSNGQKSVIAETIHACQPEECIPKINACHFEHVGKQLFLFDVNDQSRCFPYTWCKQEKKYKCSRCPKLLNSEQSTANIFKLSNGEKFVQLYSRHSCASVPNPYYI